MMKFARRQHRAHPKHPAHPAQAQNTGFLPLIPMLASFAYQQYMKHKHPVPKAAQHPPGWYKATDGNTYYYPHGY